MKTIRRVTQAIVTTTVCLHTYLHGTEAEDVEQGCYQDTPAHTVHG